ncbi:MAG: hypothetical protein IIT49_04905, partial [Clostridia bacterium]|nr:hypothetical protein [Clostridia bacterium]
MDNKIYNKLGISNEVLSFSEKVLSELEERFKAIDETAEYNQCKVISAMHENRVNAVCFAATTLILSTESKALSKARITEFNLALRPNNSNSL